MSEKILIAEVNAAEWDASMTDFHGGVFHHSAWINAMAGKDRQALFLHFEDPQLGLVGKLAGQLVQSRLKFNKDLYFFSGLLTLGNDAVVRKTCLRSLLKYARSKKCGRIFLHAFDFREDQPMAVPGFYHKAMKEFVINYSALDGPPKISSNLKRNAAKARKAGVVVESDTSSAVLHRLMELLDTTRSTRRDKYGCDYDPMYIQGMDAASLERVLDSGLGKMFVAKQEGLIRTVLFALESEAGLYFLLMGSDDKAYELGIPSLVALELSKYAQSQGKIYYNLGVIPNEAQGGEGLRRFKEQQGASEEKAFSYYSWYLRFPLRWMNPFLSRKARRFRVDVPVPTPSDY